MDQLIYAAEAELLEPLTAAERKTLLGLLSRLTANRTAGAAWRERAVAVSGLRSSGARRRR